MIVKGFVLDNEKLKNPDNPFGKDYFDELLEQMRPSFERKTFYRKITDIYALGVDCNPTAEEIMAFFKAVQKEPKLKYLQVRANCPIKMLE